MRKPCFVYLFGHQQEEGISGPVKVGISENPVARLHGLSTACAYPIVSICCVAAPTRAFAQAVERKIHADLAQHRINGEWFEITPLTAVETFLVVFREGFEAAGFNERDFYEVSLSNGIADTLTKYVMETERFAALGVCHE